MPYVRSYYRRSAGAATMDEGRSTRALSVAIYAAGTSTELLRARSGIGVTGLRFTTGLPGGFLECSFTLEAAGAKLAGVDTGQKVIVRCGNQVVWWGWIEDVARVVRGRLVQLSVTCMGPVQELMQRTSSPSYTSIVGSVILTNEIISNCPNISQDMSQMVDSGVPLTLSWSDRSIMEIGDAVSAAGDLDGNALLFAVWEPGLYRSPLAQVQNVTPDPLLEQEATYWDCGTATFQTTYYYSAVQAVLWGPSLTDWVRTHLKYPVIGSATYIIDYYTLWSAHSGMTVRGRVDWYTAADTIISSDYTSAYTSDGTTTTWQRRIQTLTAPATAATARMGIEVATGAGAGRYTVVDDVRFYLAAAAKSGDDLPRVHLWARDVSDYDYAVYTGRLAQGWQLTETTRQLANYVVATYSGGTTAAAEDATSQAAYRRRDEVLSLTDLGSSEAAAAAAAYLARWKDPAEEPGTLTVRFGQVLNTRGRPVAPALLRAGDRIKIMDGLRAGTTVIVMETSYEAGAMQLTPEREATTSSLLARVI